MQKSVLVCAGLQVCIGFGQISCGDERQILKHEKLKFRVKLFYRLILLELCAVSTTKRRHTPQNLQNIRLHQIQSRICHGTRDFFEKLTKIYTLTQYCWEKNSCCLHFSKEQFKSGAGNITRSKQVSLPFEHPQEASFRQSSGSLPN